MVLVLDFVSWNVLISRSEVLILPNVNIGRPVWFLQKKKYIFFNKRDKGEKTKKKPN